MKAPSNNNKSNESLTPQTTPQPTDTNPQVTGATPPLPRIQMRSIMIGLTSYVLWGIMPLFWKLLDHMDSFEILAHRLLWSVVFLVPTCFFTCRTGFLTLFRERRAILILLGAGLICTFNWGVFIFTINSGHVLQASMGYYINPLMSITIGLLVFKEKLSLAQKIALALAAIGVLFFTISYGSFPWLSLALAVSFAFYGALKKIGGYPALPALAVETTLVVPLAITYVTVAFFSPEHAFFVLSVNGAVNTDGLLNTILLICGGIVTFIPLLLFSEAVNTVPLSWMGFMQYISPTISLLLGVFAFQETFTLAHAVCFALIWTGLMLIVFESLIEQRRED